MIRKCIDCGEEFSTRTRKRTHCYSCRPAVVRSPSHTVVAPHSPPPTTSGGAADNSPHCRWCGAYVAKGMMFCNKQHKALFLDGKQEQEERARRANSEIVRKSKPQRRPIELVRALREERQDEERKQARRKAADRTKEAQQ